MLTLDKTGSLAYYPDRDAKNSTRFDQKETASIYPVYCRPDQDGVLYYLLFKSHLGSVIGGFAFP